MGNYGIAFVYCVKYLFLYLLGKQFILRTDHKNWVYLANSTVPKLVRLRIVLSEFKYLIEHIPGTSYVVSDGLTRVRWIEGRHYPDSKRYVFYNDSIERIFRYEAKTNLMVKMKVMLRKKTKLMAILKIKPQPR